MYRLDGVNMVESYPGQVMMTNNSSNEEEENK